MENPIKMDDFGSTPVFFGNTHMFNMFEFGIASVHMVREPFNSDATVRFHALELGGCFWFP